MKGKQICSNIRIEPAENGLILCYDVKTTMKSLGKGEYEMLSYNHDYKKEVFTVGEADKAVARMMKLVGGMVDEMDSSEKEEKEEDEED